MSSLLLFAIFIRAASPRATSVCIWGHTGDYAMINGLYSYVGTHEEAPYYAKTSASGCFSMFLYADDEWEGYVIKDVLTTDVLNPFAYCPTDESISSCSHAPWLVFDPTTAQPQYAPSINVTIDSPCPHIWQCDTVHIPSLPNGCDTFFDVHLAENIWTNSANTHYWYWNEARFMWKCDTIHPLNTPCNKSHSYLASTTAQWVHISQGASASLSFKHPPSVHTVYCLMDTTIKPTTTIITTASPTEFVPTTTTSAINTIITTTTIPSHLSTIDSVVSSTQLPSITSTLPLSSITSTSPLPPITSTLNPVVDSTIRSTQLRSVTSTPNPTVRSILTTKQREAKVDEKTTTKYTIYTTEHVRYYDGEKIDKFWIIVMISGSVVAFCALCLVIICIYYYNGGKAKHVEKSLSGFVDDDCRKKGAKMSVPQLPRERVHSESKFAEKKDEHDKKIVIQISNEPMKPKFGESNSNKSQMTATPESVLKTDTLSGEGLDADSLIFGRDRAVTEGADERMIQMERNMQERQYMREWLTKKVKLPQYYDVFVENGYETLSIMKEITEDEELKEIGIVLKGHIKKLMTEIKALRDFVD